jgi:Na+/proline symporter
MKDKWVNTREVNLLRRLSRKKLIKVIKIIKNNMKAKQMLTVWLPRVLVIVYISFFVLLSLDVFNSTATALEKIGGFFMHNIPTILLIVSLAYAWKKTRTGGIIFVILGILFTIFYGTYERLDTFVLISLPLLLVGTLFLLNKDEHN